MKKPSVKRMEELIIEITNKNEHPERDTPEDAAEREILRKQIDKIVADGFIVDIRLRCRDNCLVAVSREVARRWVV